MIHAYNHYYLEDAMNNVGNMLDCAVNAVHCDINVFSLKKYDIIYMYHGSGGFYVKKGEKFKF